jgi:hypothetical protein
MDVYQTAVVMIMDIDTGDRQAFQIAQAPPVVLGSSQID